MFKNYICALDIGTSKIAAVVVGFKRQHPESMYFESAPLRALSKGSVVESIELTRAVEKVLESLKAKSGINIKGVYTNISGQDIIIKHSHALVPLWDKRGKVITVNDVQKVNEQALILGANLDEEVLTYVANEYTVDSDKQVTHPLGLFSRRLGVDLTLICGKVSSVRSFYHVINRAGYDVKDLVFSGLATSEIIFDKNSREGLHVLCDVGGDVTEILIFKDGVPRHIEILPIGGDDITKALQDALKIPFELAEEIKKSYGAVGQAQGGMRDKEILLKEGELYKPIKQGVVIDVVTAKTQSLCSALKQCVGTDVAFDEINTFFAAGGTMLQDGLLEMLEGTMGIPVRLGRIVHPRLAPLVNQNAFALSSQKYLTYLTALGTICWVLRKQTPEFPGAPQTSRNPFIWLISKIQQIYREYF